MSSRSPRSMWKTMSSNPMPRSVLSFAFFASSQSKYFTDNQVSTTCALQAHIGVGFSVPASVPKLDPRTIQRQPTPTNLLIENGPEIVNFRPVLESRVTLANRRLQPLGHLTASVEYTEHRHLRKTLRSEGNGLSVRDQCGFGQKSRHLSLQLLVHLTTLHRRSRQGFCERRCRDVASEIDPVDQPGAEPRTGPCANELPAIEKANGRDGTR